MSRSEGERTLIRVANKKAYIWDVSDIALLRSKHRICGILTGTLPHLSQQNVFLGAPLVLMPEEVVLIVDKGIAAIVDDPHAHLDPSKRELEAWSNTETEKARQQIEADRQKSAAGSSKSKAMSEEAIRKRQEREAKKAQNAAKASKLDAPVTPTPPPSEPSASPMLSVQTAQYTIEIPATSDQLSWYSPSQNTHETIASAKAAGIWDFPSNLHERARCGVFRGLWEQGYFLGGGIKFGGEYLVYPGDPLRYHSHFAATVIDSPTSTIQPMEIVAHGRLGTATKKAHLLCGWDDERSEASYLSIEWSGFG